VLNSSWGNVGALKPDNHNTLICVLYGPPDAEACSALVMFLEKVYASAVSLSLKFTGRLAVGASISTCVSFHCSSSACKHQSVALTMRLLLECQASCLIQADTVIKTVFLVHVAG
jgi:hypothetical protein